jgi:hypothetical protein
LEIMGLLDDAIREHLDLKRRRGADPTEIAREESEALGPVRRGDVELTEPVAAPPVAEEPILDDHAPNHVDPYPEPEAESATPPHGDPLQSQVTREFSADEVGAAVGDEPDPDVVPADEGDPDVLQETPDFLQETPEHDRLWFEQKPPKDFDF